MISVRSIAPKFKTKLGLCENSRLPTKEDLNFCNVAFRVFFRFFVFENLSVIHVCIRFIVFGSSRAQHFDLFVLEFWVLEVLQIFSKV
jgi:hypothetical protein